MALTFVSFVELPPDEAELLASKRCADGGGMLSNCAAGVCSGADLRRFVRSRSDGLSWPRRSAG
eukprot:scaffold481679_cov37-Prasinocladus_malaysianus.AAC.1